MGKTLYDMANVMNEVIYKLIIWLNINKLKLNVKKTHFMLFSPHRGNNVNTIKIYVGNEEILQVQSTKFLGVYIDDKLSWERHITYIKAKVAKGIGIINKARKYLSLSCLKTLLLFLVPILELLYRGMG